MKREEEGFSTAAAPGANGCLDEFSSDESGVIADGEAGWGDGLLMSPFFATELCPFGDGIVNLLLV